MSPPPPASRRATLFIALAGAAAALCACTLWVRDHDMFHHLAMGRHIVRHGLGAGEPFLYPVLGASVGPPPYWLGSVAIYGWHVLFGDGGLAFLPALAGAALFTLLFADSFPRGGRHTLPTLAAAALPLVLALESFRFRATARPDLFGMIALALTALAVRRFEDGRPRLLLAFPLLALLWTNVHPSVVAGLLLVALLAGATALGGARARRPAAVAALVAVAATAASALSPSPANPVGVALRFAATLFGVGAAPAGAAAPVDGYAPVRMLVGELTPPGVDSLATAPGLLLCLTALSFLLRWRTPRARELLTVAAFAVLASRGVRFAAVMAIACAPIAARNLGEALSRLPERRGWLRAQAVAAAALLAVAAAHPALASGAPELSFGTRLWPAAYPVRGADYLADIGFDGHLYNSFQLGGYLEWRGLPAYQDGRGFVPDGTLEASLVGPDDPGTFAALDARYRFDALLLAYHDLSGGDAESLRALKGADDWMAGRERWALVAFDDGGLLYLRRDGKYADRAQRDEFELAMPGNDGVQLQRSKLPLLLAEYERSVRESPACGRCRLLFATFALAAGRADEAERMLAPALEDGPRFLPALLLVAARAAEARGEPERAGELYARFLAAGADDPEARRGLARVALAAGDASAAERALRPNLAGGQRDPEDCELASRVALARGRPEDAAAWLRAGSGEDAMAAARRHLDAALAAERLKDLDGAVASYGASLAAFEANAAAHSNLGYVLQKKGALDEAVAQQRRALELDPRLAAAQYGLGTALADRGDRAGAATALRRYLALEPHGYWALKATQRLAELERR